ncbi:hypothetical protein [Granulicella arctica]|uniref:hypothetical protein n=1 Tax=Granulicella arctica TaxID=940613 RepID=UPI0021E030B9|nr:hypothetical protein [Granulicella arctica]
MEFAAEVVDIRLESRVGARHRWQMLLSVTSFSETASTGRLDAVAPSGARLEVPVLGVVVEDGEVWHVVEKPLAAGTSVTGWIADLDEEHAGSLRE